MKRKEKVNIVILDKINDEGIKLLKKNFNIIEKYGLTNDELLKYFYKEKNANEIALVIRSTRKIDKPLIKKFAAEAKVRLICSVSSGYDNIDVDVCKIYKIKALNVPEGNYVSTSEHTFSMILAIHKQLYKVHNELKHRKYMTGYNISNEVNGKSIGVIGVGRIGSVVARFARNFGMKVYGNDIKQSVINKYKWIRFVSLKKLLNTCDVITVHTPLDRTTRHLINKKNIKLVKPEGIIINCARGGIIEEQALYDSLKRKKISFAGLDVYENEPDIDFRFTKLDNVLLSPHIAGKTKQSHKRMSIQAAEQIINYYK